MSASHLRIRSETLADEAAIADILRCAFGQNDEALLVQALRTSTEYIPALSLIAEQDSAVRGHVLLTQVHIEQDTSDCALGLGPLAVLPGYQRSGIGTELMNASLDRAKALGYGLVVVLGHPSYYSRFGFTLARAAGLSCLWDPLGDAFQVRELVPGALAGLHGEVRYAPPFYESFSDLG
jgi:putative acetyltransferase